MSARNVNVVECDNLECAAVKFPERTGDSMKYVTGAALNDGWQKVTLEALSFAPVDEENDFEGALWFCPDHKITVDDLREAGER